MADTLTRLCGPSLLSDTAATVYTTPGATVAVVRDICVCNESGAAATFTLSIGTDGAGKRLYYNVNIPADTTFQRTGNIVLDATEILQAYSDVASALTLTISGVESA